LSNNYFIEEFISPLVKELQTYPKEEWNQKRPQEILTSISPQIMQLCHAIVFTHKFQRFDSVEDLSLNAYEQILKSIPRFKFDYVTKKGEIASLFNYFSLTAKRAMLYQTLHQKNNRLCSPYDLLENCLGTNKSTDDRTQEAIDSVVEKIEHMKYENALPKTLAFMIKHTGTFNKRNFFRFAQAMGWPAFKVRAFTKKLQDFKEQFYENCQEETYIKLEGEHYEKESF
jgi:hypothetical protein